MIGARALRPPMATFLPVLVTGLAAINCGIPLLGVGVVPAITGITNCEVTVTGEADHAGTTPMAKRADALAAAETTWDLLAAISRRPITHPRGHPLYPSSDPADLGVRPLSSLLEVRFFGDVTGHQASLTEFASSLLARDDASTVLELLTGVRGIGGTRAGRFLRDLAVWNDPRDAPDGAMTEPVDDHVDRCVGLLATRTDAGTDAGRWLVDRSGAHGLQPHRVSAGMTYFATRVAGDPYRLERCLTDIALAERLTRNHRQRLTRAAAEDGRDETGME